MNLSYLFKIQHIIDNEIRAFGQKDGEELDTARLLKTQLLALEVKTGELANLTKCYKYSGCKKHLDRKKLLIRYIDCFKFLFSIGNDRQFSVIDFDLEDLLIDKEADIVDIFLFLFEKINTLKYYLDQDNYILALETYLEIFKEYLVLGNTLGLTFEEVFDYYQKIYREMIQ